MKFATSSLFLAAATFALAICSSQENASRHDAVAEPVAENLRTKTLRKAAVEAGFIPASETWVEVDDRKAEVGALLFDSELMSLNGEISCRTCHLDKFSLTDGMPNAVGVGGTGEGPSRSKSGGQIVPRNVLPLWGRGGRGFETFFWDGKVETIDGGAIRSQFGIAPPSDDPLIVAVHLPSVELREMVTDSDAVISDYIHESVSAAAALQAELASRLSADDTLGPLLQRAFAKPANEINFLDIATAIAAFIRQDFALQSTRFEHFVFERGPISQNELAGGIVFYGKGNCVSCHRGPYMTDFNFHAVAAPTVGFGKNGFGRDWGRYNVTYRPADRYRTRTPPLANVAMTAPYFHSGSLADLETAIVAHFDPLRLYKPARMDSRERAEAFRRLGAASNDTSVPHLSDKEVAQVAEFLRMLSFGPLETATAR